MNDNMKIVKSPKESGLLIKVVSGTIQREAEKQKGGFLSMLLGTLAATFLLKLHICLYLGTKFQVIILKQF